ncbi:cell division protein [Lactococcus sp.]|uniref:cell division protein n=1 Tax=Lactococcus sp. TaxID=44273 RepID=UPI0035B4DC07
MSKVTNISKKVDEKFVSDPYFEEKHFGLKVYQTLIAILGWFGVLLPFLWLMVPFFSSHPDYPINFLYYKEELPTFQFLALFLGIIFVAILILYISLTLKNNDNYKNKLSTQIKFNEDQVEIRKIILEEEYTKRFGSAEFRKSVKSYTIKEEQNFDTHFVQELYRIGEEEIDKPC